MLRFGLFAAGHVAPPLTLFTAAVDLSAASAAASRRLIHEQRTGPSASCGLREMNGRLAVRRCPASTLRMSVRASAAEERGEVCNAPATNAALLRVIGCAPANSRYIWK